MIISKPHLLTKLLIFKPKYSTVHTTGEWVVLLAKYKVHRASPIILIEFTRAEHLKGQRFCVRRAEVERCPIVTNGRIDCYEVPMSKLEGYDTAQEVHDSVNNMFEE